MAPFRQWDGEKFEKKRRSVDFADSPPASAVAHYVHRFDKEEEEEEEEDGGPGVLHRRRNGGGQRSAARHWPVARLMTSFSGQ